MELGEHANSTNTRVLSCDLDWSPVPTKAVGEICALDWPPIAFITSTCKFNVPETPDTATGPEDDDDDDVALGDGGDFDVLVAAFFDSKNARSPVE